MSVKELLEEAGADSAVVLARFGNNEALLERFIKKFPADPNFESLKEAIGEVNVKNIEIYSHTLKGVTANLGFDNLSARSAAIVNAVRGGETKNLESLFAELKTEYVKVVEGINTLS